MLNSSIHRQFETLGTSPEGFRARNVWTNEPNMSFVGVEDKTGY